MAAMSQRARTRVICKVFIKAPPEAVWDAMCHAVKKRGGGEVMEADPPGRLISAVGAAGRNAQIGSSLLSFELRDTLTGYTAVTVSCEPDRAAGAQESATCASGWDRLLADLKTVIEAGRCERHRTVLPRSSPRSPLGPQPKLAPQALAPQALAPQALAS
jgi:uncharacterized protein YndB with AHSA1/START domain